MPGDIRSDWLWHRHIGGYSTCIRFIYIYDRGKNSLNPAKYAQIYLTNNLHYYNNLPPRPRRFFFIMVASKMFALIDKVNSVSSSSTCKPFPYRRCYTVSCNTDFTWQCTSQWMKLLLNWLQRVNICIMDSSCCAKLSAVIATVLLTTFDYCASDWQKPNNLETAGVGPFVTTSSSSSATWSVFFLHKIIHTYKILLVHPVSVA